MADNSMTLAQSKLGAVSEHTDWPHEVVSECCGAEWDEDNCICLKCKGHAAGMLLGTDELVTDSK